MARRSSSAEGEVVGLDCGYVRESSGSRSGSMSGTSCWEVNLGREELENMLSQLEVVRRRRER